MKTKRKPSLTNTNLSYYFYSFLIYKNILNFIYILSLFGIYCIVRWILGGWGVWVCSFGALNTPFQATSYFRLLQSTETKMKTQNQWMVKKTINQHQINTVRAQLTFWNALLKCVTSNCVYALLGNYKMGIRIALRCHIRAVHAAIVCICVHKFDCTSDMDTPPIDRVPRLLHHLKWNELKKEKEKKERKHTNKTCDYWNSFRSHFVGFPSCSVKFVKDKHHHLKHHQKLFTARFWFCLGGNLQYFLF